MKVLKILIIISIFGFGNVHAQEGDLPDRLKMHTSILASDSLEGRGLGTLGKEKAVDYIVKQFEATGLMPFDGKFQQSFEFKSGLAWVPAINIVGYLPGKDPVLKDEFIVVGAHYDHLGYSLKDGEKTIFYGADDNASGVASIIELATRLNNNSDNLKRSVLFIAFDAEESGLIGSTRFIEKSPISIDQIKLMFSLDMVGMYSTHGGVDLKGMESLVGGAKIAESVASSSGINVKRKGSDIEARTDTKPFGDVGIPAVHVFTGLKSPYHKPGDQYNLLDYEGMALINQYLEALLTQLANEPKLAAAPTVEVLKPGSKKKAVVSGGILVNNGGGYHYFPDSYFTYKKAYDFSAGMYANIGVGRLVSIQPEVLYELIGTQSSQGNFRRQSVAVPLNIQVGTPRMSGFRLYLFGGAYYRYVLSAKDEAQTYEIGSEVNQDEWGYNYGFGLDIRRFTLAWTLRRGLTNVMELPVSTTNRSRSSLFTLGYRF